MQSEEKIKFVNGDSIQITFTVYKDERLVSLDGASIRFLLSYYGSDNLILEKAGVQTENIGEFIVNLLPTDTEGLNGIFDYQIEITDINGKVNTTFSKQIDIFKKIS